MNSPVATTLKVAADLKRRVVAATKTADKSPHTFMLEAIQHQTRLDEQRRAIVAEVVASRSEALASGKGFAAADMHRSMAARIRGDRMARPKVRSWRKWSTRDAHLPTWSAWLILWPVMHPRPPLQHSMSFATGLDFLSDILWSAEPVSRDPGNS